MEVSPGNVAPRILSRPEHNISRKNIDPDALKVLYRLEHASFVAYLVGGGVRDLLLERAPKDFDIGTSAHPQQVRKLFRNCFIVGRRYRLAHVRFGHKVIEVSTFRRAAEPVAGDQLIRRDNTVGTPEEEAFQTAWQNPPEAIQQSKGRFIWPVKGKIVAHYGVKKGMKYDGIDIQAPLGTAIRAADAGTVAFVNVLPGYGNIIIIKHRDSYSTVYAHNQMNLVREGSRVSRGAVIARLGNSHNPASSPTLHFQIRRYNKARNPLFYLH